MRLHLLPYRLKKKHFNQLQMMSKFFYFLQMESWYFAKETLVAATASRLDGVDGTTEGRYRREGVQLIQSLCRKLDLYPS